MIGPENPKNRKKDLQNFDPVFINFSKESYVPLSFFVLLN